MISYDDWHSNKMSLSDCSKSLSEYIDYFNKFNTIDQEIKYDLFEDGDITVYWGSTYCWYLHLHQFKIMNEKINILEAALNSKSETKVRKL